MRRRLWWSLILFDTRICEMADYKLVMLVPTWDCRTPLNVNDFDLQPEMKDLPRVQGKSTEAVFAVMRGEIGEFIRHSAFHLDFTIPALKAVAKDVYRGNTIPGGGELSTLENMIEERILKFCNPENPLHFTTIWMARGHLAKYRLVESFAAFSRSPVGQTSAQRDAAFSHALTMLECDTKLIASPLTKGYRWFIHFYFPFPAYVHLMQDLKRRPIGDHATKSWATMNENYEAHFLPPTKSDNNASDKNPFFTIFARIVLQAWEAREAMFRQSEKELPSPPRIVSDIRRRIVQPTQDPPIISVEQPRDVYDGSDLGVNDFSSSMPIDFFGGHGMLYGMEGRSFEGLGTGNELAALDIMDVGQLDWNMMDWDPMQGRSW